MKKVLAFVLAGMMCFCLVSPAQAATNDEQPAVSVSNGTPTTRGFVRDVRLYFTIGGDYKHVLSDANYDIFEDQYITVSSLDESGPSDFVVQVSAKEDGATNWETIETGIVSDDGTAASFTIKKGYEFRVDAKATDGRNGEATIQVVLS